MPFDFLARYSGILALIASGLWGAYVFHIQRRDKVKERNLTLDHTEAADIRKELREENKQFRTDMQTLMFRCFENQQQIDELQKKVSQLERENHALERVVAQKDEEIHVLQGSVKRLQEQTRNS